MLSFAYRFDKIVNLLTRKALKIPFGHFLVTTKIHILGVKMQRNVAVSFQNVVVLSAISQILPMRQHWAYSYLPEDVRYSS